MVQGKFLCKISDQYQEIIRTGGKTEQRAYANAAVIFFKMLCETKDFNVDSLIVLVAALDSNGIPKGNFWQIKMIREFYPSYYAIDIKEQE